MTPGTADNFTRLKKRIGGKASLFSRLTQWWAAFMKSVRSVPRHVSARLNVAKLQCHPLTAVTPV